MKLLTPKGGKALLDFLRNLTPQILILSSAIALFIGAGKPTADFPGVMYVLSVCLLGVWLAALMANVEAFLDEAFSDSDFMKAEKRRLKFAEKSQLRRIWLLFCSTARHSKITFVEAVAVMVVTYVAIITVLIGAVAGALKFSG